VLLLAALNPRPSVSLRLLTSRSPALPLGVWLAAGGGAGALLSGLATVLALLDAGLARLPNRREASLGTVPLVSFPKLDYWKRDATAPTAPDERLRSRLSRLVGSTPLGFLDEVLALLPLRVDDIAELESQRNDLAAVIGLAPYRNSKISVVTETGLDSKVLRITEKTLKAAALGHPFVTIGCRDSLGVLRSFGYSAFDDLIDQRYDSHHNERERLLGAVRSAKQFVGRFDADPAFRRRVREQAEQNIRWTLHGFAPAYAASHGDPLIRFLRGSAQPPPSRNLHVSEKGAPVNSTEPEGNPPEHSRGGGTIRLRHVINMIGADAPASLRRAQEITLQSIERAVAFSNGRLQVDVVAVTAPQDRPDRPWLRWAPIIWRTLRDIPSAHSDRPLPFLADVLEGFWLDAAPADGSDPGWDIGIYTNVDIAVQPYFYELVLELFRGGNDALSIMRRTVSDGSHVSSLVELASEVGESHPGHDCFAFTPAVLRRCDVGDVVLGIPRVGLSFLTNLRLHATNFSVRQDLHATFHLGNERPWTSGENAGARAHNHAAMVRVIEQLRLRFGSEYIDQLPLLARFLTSLQRGSDT